MNNVAANMKRIKSDNVGNDQPKAAERIQSVEYLRGNADIKYCKTVGSEDIEKKVPHRKVIGTTTTLVINIIVVRLLDRKPANTPKRENVKEDKAMHNSKMRFK